MEKEKDNKNFDKWNERKKEINLKDISCDFFFYEREVWWAFVGLNIGIESDGKNENFERPVLIIKKFKRLLRKIGMISEVEFVEVINKLNSYIKIGPRISARSSEA